MRVNRAEALRVLRLIKPGLARREIIEQTGACLFVDDRIITYNDEISVSAPFPVNLQGAVSASDLYEFFERTSATTVDITFDDERLYIRCGDLEADIKKTKEILLPLENIVLPGPNEWLNLPADFKKMLKQCLMVASKSWNKPILRCVHWYCNSLEATDNYRIIRCKIDVHLPEGPRILITRNTITELVKYNLVAFAFSNGWAHFKIENDAVFSCRVFEGRFPDLELAFSGDYVPIPFPSGRLADILDRSIQYAQNDSVDRPRVMISIVDSYLTVEAGKEGARFKETCKIAFRGSLKFYADPKMLKETLKMKFDKAGVGKKDERAIFIRFEKKDITYLMVFGIAP